MGGALLFAGLYAIAAWRTHPLPDHPYFDRAGMEVIAHRGGGGLWPENTLEGFQRAVHLSVDVLEMDIRSTKDSVLVVIHDATVDRTTDGRGNVRDFALTELKRLDAGYRWTQDEGQTFPFRGKGITIPTLSEVFDAFPNARLNIEIKHTDSGVVQPVGDLIRQHNMVSRVMVACFDSNTLQQFRTQYPEIATSAGLAEGLTFYLLSRLHLGAAYRPNAEALQLPKEMGPLNGLHPAFLSAARAHNIKIHVWTINDTTTMRSLINLYVDGIMTIYPDRLLKLLAR